MVNGAMRSGRLVAGRALLAAGLAFTLAGCRAENSASAAHTTVEAAPPEVGVVTARQAPVTLVKELPGRITPMRIAEVRPRVSGIVVDRAFEQGSVVKEGGVLYRIDPKPFEVELQSARAALAKAQAVFEQANRQEDRLRALLSGATTTQAQYDIALAAERQAEAEVQAQRAVVSRAQLNLDYATVRAPITGRIGRALVTEGALVAAETTHLATVQQLDPVYADFTQSVAELNQLRRALESGELKGVAPGQARARLFLDDGTEYPHDGRILFSDVTVDPGTAKVAMRGEFPNPKADLLPGMYVRVRIDEAVDTDAITVPGQAVQRNNAGGAEFFIINEEGRAVLVPVRLGRNLGSRVVVEDGLKPGQRVVVDGFQKFTPGSAVRPVEWSEANEVAAGTRVD